MVFYMDRIFSSIPAKKALQSAKTERPIYNKHFYVFNGSNKTSLQVDLTHTAFNSTYSFKVALLRLQPAILFTPQIPDQVRDDVNGSVIADLIRNLFFEGDPESRSG